MKASENIHIGTSGWHYDHWRGPFYPEDLSNEVLLSYYANVFQTVEINNSFYHLPAEKTFTNWRDSVPDGFIFSVKASRHITHMKKLYDISELSGWADAISTWASGSKKIYCYFDNDERGYAAQDALRLKEMVED